MKKLLTFVFVSIFLIAGASISVASEMDKGSMQKGSMKGSDSSGKGAAVFAKALIKGTRAGSKINGTVNLIETGGGVQVVASLSGVTPAGKHGFHIHAKGSCDNGGKAAGGHFNPVSTKHGLLLKDGHDKAHTGDMGNITIDENGDGMLVAFLPRLSLVKGNKNVMGRAIILHEKEDDFGQPTGNAGSRIGCGKIRLSKE